MAGVNAELAPFVRMTHPADRTDIASLGGDRSLLGQVAFRSWLCAFGIVPFDRHALRLLDVEDLGVEGGSFQEDSSSWLQSRWRHRREVVADGTGCRVTDRLEVVPRVPIARPVTAALVRFLFGHRHRRLVDRFGAAPGPVQSTERPDLTGRQIQGDSSR